jgi:1,4-dihydroxy-2-naphthoate octaprenyltransferase
MAFKTVVKAFKPFRLVSLACMYILGGGLVQYIEHMRDWTVFIEGGIFLFLFAVSMDLLSRLQLLNDREKWPEGMTRESVKTTRIVVALTAAAFLTVVTSILIGWMAKGFLWQGLTFLLTGTAVAGALYYLTQVLDSLHIHQILVEVVLFVAVPPALAYFLQSQETNRMLTMAVISLAPAYIAYRLLEQLRDFTSDQRLGNKTIVTMAGWERAMVLHNAFILLVYFLIALCAILGFPWFLIWPIFLTLPIGLVEIWMMERVRQGKKPLWRVMGYASASVLFIPIYLLGFAFWIR